VYVIAFNDSNIRLVKSAEFMTVMGGRMSEKTGVPGIKKSNFTRSHKTGYHFYISENFTQKPGDRVELKNNQMANDREDLYLTSGQAGSSR